jgi:N-acetylmuramoyl-L-alanine amidase
MRILLDAGHGGKDNGAEAGGVQEKNITLDIALWTDTYLRKFENVETILMRLGDKTLHPKYRLKAIMDYKPDAFVSFHCNAIADNPVTPWDERDHTRGFEIFYRDAEDKKLGACIMRVLDRSDLWEKNRGLKNDEKWLSKHLMVLNSLNVHSVLLELGFLTHKENRNLLLNKSQEIAELVAHGILDYLSKNNKG